MERGEPNRAPGLRHSVERKIYLRLILPVGVITFVNSIDRVNISFAGSAMSRDIGLSPSQFGLGVSMFFVAYLVFQYPHVRLLRAWGVKSWIFVSMLLWAASGLWMSQIHGPGGFYGARFLLGMAEAGLAPGMTHLISNWTPLSIRARALSGALVAAPLAMVLGGPLCGWMLGMANPLQLAPWRFMFVLIAAPNLLLAFAAAAWLFDRPGDARWLARDEQAWLAAEFARQQAAPRPERSASVSIARDPWLWRASAAWLLIMTGSYALVFWLPQLVRQLAIGRSEFMIATLSATPLLGIAIGLVANGRHSDRTGERLLHVSLPSAFAGVAMLLAASLPPGWPVLALLVFAGLGIGAAQGVFWAIPAAVGIGGGAVPAGAIAWINMAGTAGGIVGPYLTGALLARSGSFSLPTMLLASLLIIVAPVLTPFHGKKKPDATAQPVA